MNKLKQQIYCNYMKYIEEHWPHFKEYIEDTCTRFSLKLPKGKGIAGLTLMIPDNKELKSTIEKGIESDSDDDVGKTIALMKTLIVHAYLPDLSAWKAQMDDIPLSNGKKLKVISVDNKSVTLDGGATLILDENFRRREESSKVAIWVIKSGIPKSTDLDAEYKHTARRTGPTTKSTKTGSYQPNNVEPEFNRSLYMNVVLAAYEWDIMSARTSGTAYKNQIFEFAASLIDFIAHSSDYKKYLPDALSVCNMGYSDIFLLLEPCAEGLTEYLLPIDLIDAWWKDKKAVDPVTAYSHAYSQVSSNAACFSQRKALNDAMNNYRYEHPPNINTFNDMITMYTTLSNTNSIFGINNVFPERVAKRYKLYPNLKLNEDDIRYVLEVKFANYEKSGEQNLQELKEILKIYYMFDQHKGELTVSSGRVINHDKLRKFGVQNLDSVVKPVYNSNLIMYFPHLGDSVLDGYSTDLDHDGPVDYNAYNYEELNKHYSNRVLTVNDMLMSAMHTFSRAVNRYMV